MLLVGRVPRQQLTATSKPLWLGLTRGQRALDASTLLTVGRIDGMGISRRLRDVTCQSLLTALRRGVGSRRRGLTLLGSLDPVYGPSEPRGKTTPPRPGGAWHIHSTNTYRCGWVGEKSYCVISPGIAETERERGGEQRERSSEPHAVCRRGAIDNTSAKQLLTSAINLEIPRG